MTTSKARVKERHVPRIATLEDDVADPFIGRPLATDLQHLRCRVDRDHRAHVAGKRAPGDPGPGGHVEQEIIEALWVAPRRANRIPS